MPESKIVLSPIVHTAQLRDVSGELIHYALQAAEYSQEQLLQVEEKLGDIISPTILRRTISVAALPKSTRVPWSRHEAWLAEFLASISPELTRKYFTDVIVTASDGVPMSAHTTIMRAQYFLTSTIDRISSLAGVQVPEQIDSLTFASLAYGESRYLRQALSLRYGIYTIRT